MLRWPAASLSRFPLLRAMLCVLLLFPFLGVEGQRPTERPAPSEVTAEIPTAPVLVDGNTLFIIKGVSAYPAEKRAQQIADRIRGLARDHGFSTQNLRVAETQFATQVWGGDQLIVSVFDEDARLDNAPRQIVGQIYLAQIKSAIEAFRRERQPGLLLRHAIYASLALLFLSLWLMAGSRILAWIRTLLERRYKSKIHGVEIQALQILHARHIWNLLRGALVFCIVVIDLIAIYATVYYVLSQFPWTQGLSRNLSALFLNPLSTIGSGFVDAIPNLIFLAVLVLIIHYVLKLVRVLFNALESGAIKAANFDPTWAKPTYRLVRAFIVAFGLVVAFPYIPGSETQAFKGLSLFVGLIVSLGSTSLIGNLISGYSLTYRRVFKPGDRVRIGDHVGYVQDSKLMVTYLYTVKNEVIAVPNSQIMNAEVINYSSLARTEGVILHTAVGIGYETPWRQVEAMLLEAASRTPGLMRDRRPFVRQKELGNFAVVYEINVYCDEPQEIESLYTLLHQNILDIFNEYGVQIMTPAYEGDPEQAKVVPKSKWFSAPAPPEDGYGNRVASGD